MISFVFYRRSVCMGDAAGEWHIDCRGSEAAPRKRLGVERTFGDRP